MENITKYNVVRSTDPIEFCELINQLINQGWQPFGGVSTLLVHVRSGQLYESGDARVMMTQALVTGKAQVKTP